MESEAGSTCAPRCADDGMRLLCADGVPDKVVSCALGCVAGSRCAALDPVGAAIPEDFSSASADTRLASPDGGPPYVLNTSNGGISGVRAPGEGDVNGITVRFASQVTSDAGPSPEVAIFGFRSFSVAEGATLSIVGSRAAVIVARDELSIEGIIDADCQAKTPGPGSTPGPGGFGPDDYGIPGRGQDSAFSESCGSDDKCAGGGG
ncbi:MAG TPA: hypothetical protein VM580_06525, partial [Labilithrix sp.]|nr:hypothetical protein [Labilithrix sp.]